MNEQEHKVIEAMEQYGDSFVKALAVCFLRADGSNWFRLHQAFHEYWDKYTKMVKLIEERKKGTDECIARSPITREDAVEILKPLHQQAAMQINGEHV